MTTNVSPEKVRRVLKALPGTRSEIAERAQIGKTTAGFALIHLRNEGKVFIGGWARPFKDQRPAPVYHLGESADVELPDRVYAYRPRKRDVVPVVGSLSPRVDPLIWRTAGRNPPEIRQ